MSVAGAVRGARVRVVAGVVAFAAALTGAVVADGYDAQRTTRVESSVWVARDAGQYARFDTDLVEKVDRAGLAVHDGRGIIDRRLAFVQ